MPPIALVFCLYLIFKGLISLLTGLENVVCQVNRRVCPFFVVVVLNMGEEMFRDAELYNSA